MKDIYCSSYRENSEIKSPLVQCLLFCNISSYRLVSHNTNGSKPYQRVPLVFVESNIRCLVLNDSVSIVRHGTTLISTEVK